MAGVGLAYCIYEAGGMLMLSHDYMAQEIPFQIFCTRAIKSGAMNWSWSIDIGSDVLTSFSFYTFGSPFFWLLMLVPEKMIPYAMGYVYMLKYAVAGVTSYFFFMRYLKKKRFGLMASMLYAFSGFSSINLLFYHFHDVIALFPLMLIGLERLVIEKKRGMFAITCAISALCNYYFFMGEALFLILFYVFRFLIPERKTKTIKEQMSQIGTCFVEGALGLMISGILFIPSVYTVLQSGKASDNLSFLELFLHAQHNYLLNFKALFLPAEIMCNQASGFPEDWYSCAAYLPLVGAFLAVVYVWNRRQSWLSNLLATCLLIANVPGLNSSFSLLSSQPYRRWFFMWVLFMALASVKVIEDIFYPDTANMLTGDGADTGVLIKGKKALKAESARIKRDLAERIINPSYRFKWPAIIYGALIVLLYVLLKYVKWMFDWFKAPMTLELRPFVFNAYFAIAISGFVLTLVLIVLAKTVKMKRYLQVISVSLVIITAIYGAGLTAFAAGLYQQEEGNPDHTTGYNDLVWTSYQLNKDILPYRYSIYYNYYNRELIGDFPCRSSFLTTIEPSIIEFYHALGEERIGNISPIGPEGVNELLSTYYYVVSCFPWDDQEAVQTFVNDREPVFVYEGSWKLPIGFTYDSYMPKSGFSLIDPVYRGMLMLNTLVIPDEMEAEVSQYLPRYNRADFLDYRDFDNRTAIIENRKKECTTVFQVDDNGDFRSVITAADTNYAFFSVPYSKWWTATVNGEPTEVIKINGLMAVKIGAGNNEIQFHYHNKMRDMGVIVTILGVLGFAAYMIICSRMLKGIKKRK